MCRGRVFSALRKLLLTCLLVLLQVIWSRSISLNGPLHFSNGGSTTRLTDDDTNRLCLHTGVVFFNQNEEHKAIYSQLSRIQLGTSMGPLINENRRHCRIVVIEKGQHIKPLENIQERGQK